MPRSPIPYYMRISLRHLATASSRRELAAAKLQHERDFLALDALVKGIFQHMAGDVEIPGQMEVEQGGGVEIIQDNRGRLVGRLVVHWPRDNRALLKKGFGSILSPSDLSDLELLELPTESSSDDDDQAAFWIEANLMALATMAKERAASLEKTRDYVQANCADALRR